VRDQLAVLERGADLVLDVLFEAADVEAADLVVGELRGVGDRGRVEQVHQAGEALGPAVVRGRGGEDQRITGLGEQAGEAGAHRGLAALDRALGDVLALVDDDHVPLAVLEISSVLLVLLERVDRDDRPIVEMERVHVGGDPLLHPLDAPGVEADQRDREAGPQLLLELLEHRAQGDHEDPLATSAADQLGEENADLDRLAEADAVGDQDPRPRLGQGLGRGHELVAGWLHRAAVADRKLAGGRR
jgi:hypothetical protein